jgi:hypothetical protein
LASQSWASSGSSSSWSTSPSTTSSSGLSGGSSNLARPPDNFYYAAHVLLYQNVFVEINIFKTPHTLLEVSKPLRVFGSSKESWENKWKLKSLRFTLEVLQLKAFKV